MRLFLVPALQGMLSFWFEHLQVRRRAAGLGLHWSGSWSGSDLSGGRWPMWHLCRVGEAYRPTIFLMYFGGADRSSIASPAALAQKQDRLSENGNVPRRVPTLPRRWRRSQKPMDSQIRRRFI